MAVGNGHTKDKEHKSKAGDVEEDVVAPGKSPDRIASVKDEFVRLGLSKTSETVRELAARSITGEIELSEIARDEYGVEVETLIGLYQETKFAEFLRNGFDKLSVKGKLAWLRNTVEGPESGIQSMHLGMVLSGRGGSAASALLKAYQDKEKKVKDYARLILEKVFLAAGSSLVTRANVGLFLDELCRIYQISQPYIIKEERLKGTATILRSFLFNWGSNIYTLSYRKNGRMAHTLIDTGERRYKTEILKILWDNGIEPENIERILLTHHHLDHSGMIAVLCLFSGARVLLHPDFRIETVEWDMARFGKYLEWLPQAKEGRTRDIGGVAFPILGEAVDVGEGARLEILSLPKGDSLTHTVDQLCFLYTPKKSPATLEKIGLDFRPTDEILFSGDLWLMHPPGFSEETIGNLKISALIKERRRRFDHRPQNRKEKKALKMGSSLTTVKPGHGPEFLGSRIINTLLANRDILVKLGFDEDEKKDVLHERELALPIKQLREQSYRDFLEELKLWLNSQEEAGFGYQIDEVSRFLLRIYEEQTGGGELVGEDRKERRIDLRKKLAALKTDVEQPEALHLVAESALSLIARIS
jgi:glyoxylase-like metal-dependent hydrolase (beta-lactamase superfamily II)